MRVKEFNWGPGIFLITYQLILLTTIPFYFYYFSPSWSTIAVTFILLYLTGLSITAGYHRLYSHRAYKVHPIIEGIILFFGSMAGQGSALRWAFDHRLHHAHVDTDEDPYSIKKGFWYAHFLWILEKPREIDPKVVPDLMKNTLVQFQHRYCGSLMLGTNVLVYFMLAPLLNDYWGMFFLASWGRLFLLHHFTWFINSLAHTWGDKPFCKEQSAVNNYIIALLTFGEGYHNYHHVYANDYRNGIRWYHFDPTKWLIWGWSKLGLAYGLKRMDPYTIRKRMVLERKELLRTQANRIWSEQREELEQKIEAISTMLLDKLQALTQLKEKYAQLKSEKCIASLSQVKAELKELKKSLRSDWKEWHLLSRSLMV